MAFGFFLCSTGPAIFEELFAVTRKTRYYRKVSDHLVSQPAQNGHFWTG